MHNKIGIYYITYTCNDTCEFDNIWNDKEFQNVKEAPIEKHLENLVKIKNTGISNIDIKGGEPLLYEKLPEFLQKAKDLNLYVKLTTNGILYKDRAKELKGLINDIYFSLDYPYQEDHDRSRGVECFSDVISSIQLAKDLGENPAILFIPTRDSIRFTPEMVDLANILGVKLYVHTVFDFHGMYGYDKDSYGYLKYYFKRKNIEINLAEIEFLKDHGNKTMLPRCRASQTTITFLPDGKQASPCFFNQGGAQGKERVCYGCARWPYMLPSFTIGLDKYRLLDWYSKWFNNRKPLD